MILVKRITIDLEREEEAFLFICVTWRRRVVYYHAGLVFVNVTDTRRWREVPAGQRGSRRACRCFLVFHIFVRVVVRRITLDTQRKEKKSSCAQWESLSSFDMMREYIIVSICSQHMELEYRQYRESSYVKKGNLFSRDGPILRADAVVTEYLNLPLSHVCTLFSFLFFLFLVSIIGFFFSSTVIEFISAVMEFFI